MSVELPPPAPGLLRARALWRRARRAYAHDFMPERPVERGTPRSDTLAARLIREAAQRVYRRPLPVAKRHLTLHRSDE